MSTTMEVVRCQACDAVLEVIPEGGDRTGLSYCDGCNRAEPYGSTRNMAPDGMSPREPESAVCCEGYGVELVSRDVRAVYQGAYDEADPSRVYMNGEVVDYVFDYERLDQDVQCSGCGRSIDVEVIW